MSQGLVYTAVGSNSQVQRVYSSIDPGVGNTIGMVPPAGRTEVRVQCEGVNSSTALKYYSVTSTTSIQIASLAVVGPILNVSAGGAANTGAITTGNLYTSVGILNSVNTQRSFIIGGYLAAYDTGTNDTSCNTLEGASMSPGHWGLLRYTVATGWQQSISTNSSSQRIWSAFGAGTSSGLLNAIQLSNGSGGYSSAAGFAFDPTALVLYIPGISSAPSAPASGTAALYADATGQLYWYDHSHSTYSLVGTSSGGSVTSISCSTGQIVVSSPTGGVSLSIASTLTTAEFVSSSTTSATAFQSGSGKFLVDGLGNLSMSGGLSVNTTSGAINVTANTGYNSIQTVGGMLAVQSLANQATFGDNTFTPISQLTCVSYGNLTGSSYRGLTVQQVSNDANAANINMRKARGTSSAYAAVQSGDIIASVTGFAYDGSTWNSPSRLRWTVDGAVSSGVTPIAFQVYTGTGSVLGNLIMTIGSNGVTVWGSSVSIDQVGNISGTAVASFNGGFLTSSTSSTAINVQSGGVTALSLISVRNDGVSSVTISRNSTSGGATARTYGFATSTSGALLLNDDTAGQIRMTVDISGQFSFGSLVQINQSGAVSGSGLANFAGGFLTSNTNYNAIQSIGGIYAASVAYGMTSDGPMWSKSTTAGLPTPSASGYGAFSHHSGSIWNYYSPGSGWATFDFSAGGSVSSIGGVSGAIALSAGLSIVGGNTLTIGQPVDTTSNVTFNNVVGQFFNSSATGSSLAFQAGSGTFSVNATGAVSALNFTGSAFNCTGTAYNSIQTSGGISLETAIGEKIALFDGGAGNRYGFGIQSALLQIYTPSGGNTAIGAGSSSSFTATATFTSGGYVGIGYAAPNSQIHLFGNAGGGAPVIGTGALYLQDAGGSSFNGGSLVFGAAQGYFAGIKGQILNGTGNTQGQLTFYTRTNYSDASLSANMIIAPGGNVTISGFIVSNVTGAGVLAFQGGSGTFQVFGDGTVNGLLANFGSYTLAAGGTVITSTGLVNCNGLTANGSLTVNATGTPSLSAGGTAKIYFDPSTQMLLVSQNGSAYYALAPSGGAATFTSVTASGYYVGSTLVIDAGYNIHCGTLNSTGTIASGAALTAITQVTATTGFYIGSTVVIDSSQNGHFAQCNASSGGTIGGVQLNASTLTIGFQTCINSSGSFVGYSISIGSGTLSCGTATCGALTSSTHNISSGVLQMSGYGVIDAGRNFIGSSITCTSVSSSGSVSATTHTASVGFVIGSTTVIDSAQNGHFAQCNASSGGTIGGVQLVSGSVTIGFQTCLNSLGSFVGYSINIGSGTVNCGSITANGYISLSGSVTCTGLSAQTGAVGGSVFAYYSGGSYIYGTNPGTVSGTFSSLTIQGGIITNYSVVSDARLKTVQRSFSHGVAALRSISPVVYKWNTTACTLYDSDPNEEVIGFLAQELNSSMPDTTFLDRKGFLGIKKDAIIATLMNAVKELDARLRLLEPAATKQLN